MKLPRREIVMENRRGIKLLRKEMEIFEAMRKRKRRINKCL